MEEIVSSVNKVTEIVADISAASTEQHQGIKEISVAIDQMDQVTQQNATLVEQAAVAAQSMTEQSEALRNSVRFFQLAH
jgi:methyl-accepting chemotaxis protein